MFLKLSMILSGALRPSPQPATLAVFLFFLIGFADGSMMPFFALWAHDQAGVPVAYVGLLLACYAGGELLATPAIGGIADRVGRRPVILLSTSGVGLGFLVLAFSHGVIASAVVLILIGVCESVLHPTVSTVIADSTPADGHRRQFARGACLLERRPGCGAALRGLAGPLWARHRVRGQRRSTAPCRRDHRDRFSRDAAARRVARGSGRRRGPGRPDTGNSGSPGSQACCSGFMLLEIVGSWVETVLPLYAPRRRHAHPVRCRACCSPTLRC